MFLSLFFFFFSPLYFVRTVRLRALPVARFSLPLCSAGRGGDAGREQQAGHERGKRGWKSGWLRLISGSLKKYLPKGKWCGRKENKPAAFQKAFNIGCVQDWALLKKLRGEFLQADWFKKSFNLTLALERTSTEVPIERLRVFSCCNTHRQQDESLGREDREEGERLYNRIFPKLPVYALERACDKWLGLHIHKGKLKREKAFCILSAVPTNAHHNYNSNTGLHRRGLVMKPRRDWVHLGCFSLLLCQPKPSAVTCPRGILCTGDPC